MLGLDILTVGPKVGDPQPYEPPSGALENVPPAPFQPPKQAAPAGYQVLLFVSENKDLSATRYGCHCDSLYHFRKEK